MTKILKAVFAVILGSSVFFAAQASADGGRDHRDKRSYHSDYHYDDDDYYRDRRYRADKRYRGDRRYRNRYDRRSRYRPRSRVVNREHYPTRYRARITLVEEIYWTRSGREQLVCSVLVRGPEADYVPHRRLRRIARRDCSRYARIQYL